MTDEIDITITFMLLTVSIPAFRFLFRWLEGVCEVGGQRSRRDGDDESYLYE